MNIEKAKRQLRVMLSGPASGYMECATAVKAILDELEAAEKRIAELEARAVNLPKRSVGEVMHLSGFSRDYAEGWCAGNDNAIHEIRAAGIKVKES
ncbi:hypothetical protein H0K13_000501 [Salmonella enterica]|nr:hypothetical protein CGA23_05285 [Salmonella enterica subsp. enterica]EAA2696818.1 hypothetical protein [Salmonella enterica]ECH8185344.1 hypothetical protein [Salmonella enterica subsp. enterica serovar Rissen]ECL7191478.1 hypothetical protein [Salmonella enterica subsp. enterica serovar Muenchen]EEJ6875238.1 hypothetical protein [Salmonella enterica subsp. houtenae]EGF6409272.1 hypothetical protein [Salmonella enterica subsp. enterica serovar 6,8:d:-]EHF3500056.1 hypothetical protein [Sa